MTVQDLIKKLEGFKPETEIMFSCSIESGRSSSHVGDGSCNISHEEVYEYTVIDEEGEFVELEKENVVVIDVWGDEVEFE